MQFAHAGDNGLTRFGIRLNFERRIFFGQASKGNAHLFLVGFRLRFNSYGNNRFGEFHFFQNNGVLFVAQRIPRRCILQADNGTDITGVRRLNFFTVVSVHT